MEIRYRQLLDFYLEIFIRNIETQRFIDTNQRLFLLSRTEKTMQLRLYPEVHNLDSIGESVPVHDHRLVE